MPNVHHKGNFVRATRECIVNLLTQRRYLSAVALHQAMVQDGVLSTVKDVEAICRAFCESKPYTRDGTAKLAARHLTRVLRDNLESPHIQLQPNHYAQISRCYASLIRVLYHLKDTAYIINLRPIFTHPSVQLPPAISILFIESLFSQRSPRQTFLRDDFLSSLNSILESCLARGHFTVDMRCVLLRRLAQIAITSKTLDMRESVLLSKPWKGLIETLIDPTLFHSHSHQDITSYHCILPQNDTLPLKSRLPAKLQILWAKILVLERERDTRRRATCQHAPGGRRKLPNSPPGVLEEAIRSIVDRRWATTNPPPDAISANYVSSLAERWMAEAQRAEVLSIHALHTQYLHRAFGHLFSIERLTLAEIQRVKPGLLSLGDTHVNHILEATEKSIRIRMESTLIRILDEVIRQRRYDWLIKSFESTRLLPTFHHAQTSFLASWHSLLRLAQSAHDPTLLASASITLFKLLPRDADVGMRRRATRRLYQSPTLVRQTFLSAVARACQRSSGSGDSALRGFAYRLESVINLFKTLRIHPPSGLASAYVETAQPLVLQRRTEFDTIVLRLIDDWGKEAGHWRNSVNSPRWKHVSLTTLVKMQWL